MTGRGHGSDSLHVLFLEDDPRQAELVQDELVRGGLRCRTTRVETPKDFDTALNDGEFDLVLADYNLPGFDGLAALAMARQKCPETPFILISEALGEELAVDCLKGGATDYILKQRLVRLAPAVRRALREARGRADRKRAEQELLQWAHLFEHAEWGIAVTPIGSDRFETLNPGFARMHGYTVEELRGERIWRILPPDVEARAKEIKAQVRKEGRVRFESQHVRKDGSLFPVLVDATRLTEPSTGRTYVAFHVHDMTERKKLEEQLARAQRLEAVGTLAGGIAHDFNNILTAIMGYSDLVLADAGADGDLMQDVRDIKESAERAAALTRQLLAFSRQQILQPRIVTLNEIVSGVRKMLARVLRENIEIVTSLAPELPSIRADPGQLEQVIVNLAVNAGDAMENGGRLTIATDRCNVPSPRPMVQFTLPAGRYVVLKVTDTGTGMTDEVLSKIFEPFYTTKEHGKGTGLGLSMVYGIVKQSGGYITVESAPGEGATFQLFFPEVAAEPEPTAVDEVPARLPAGSERILLVEDDHGVRDFVRRVLERHGYQVVTASNGREALALADRVKQAWDLLLTDVVMPELNGTELAEKLSRLHPALRVLYMSGYTSQRIIGGAIEESARLLRKPFTTATLLRQVRAALDGSAPAVQP